MSAVLKQNGYSDNSRLSSTVSLAKCFCKMWLFEQADSNSLQRIFLIILYALQGCPWLSCHNNLQQRNGEGFKCAVSDVSYSGTPPKEALTLVLVLPSLPFIGMSVWERRNASTCRKVLTSAAYQSLVNSDLKICVKTTFDQRRM